MRQPPINDHGDVAMHARMRLLVATQPGKHEPAGRSMGGSMWPVRYGLPLSTGAEGVDDLVGNARKRHTQHGRDRLGEAAAIPLVGVKACDTGGANIHLSVLPILGGKKRYFVEIRCLQRLWQTNDPSASPVWVMRTAFFTVVKSACRSGGSFLVLLRRLEPEIARVADRHQPREARTERRKFDDAV